MKTRETIIRRWFDMWLQKKDLGIAEMFSDNATYIESWGPEYHGSAKIKLWFDEWNTRGTVLQWDIKQFFHKANQTMVERPLSPAWPPFPCRGSCRIGRLLCSKWQTIFY